MVRRFVTRLGLAVSVAAVVLTLTASTVLGGEVTGNGKSLKVEDSKWGTNLHARSFCAFSGQNDNPTSTNPANPPGRVQSYGYSFVRNGLKAVVPSPGDACNPHGGFEP
jgi:hypothetical protein